MKPADEFGPVLAGRSQAARLRAQIERAAHGGTEIVIDFDRVESMSPSFADELFAKLDPRLLRQGAVRFENVTPALEPLIRFVVRGRPAQRQAS